MKTVRRRSASELRALEPKLQKFTDRQIAVAQTWALHFHIQDSVQPAFILRYLRSTSKTRCWCVSLGDSKQPNQPIVARIGDRLQYFDGQTIKAWKICKKDRAHKAQPSVAAARNLLSRFEYRWQTEPLLTSFCILAREIAISLSKEDLSGYCRYVSTTDRNKRYFSPRSTFYLTQVGSTLKQFCREIDQDLLFAIRSVQCPSPKLYNWLAQGCRLRRLQALKAQPVLVPLVIIGERCPWPWNDELRAYTDSPWPQLQNRKPNADQEQYVRMDGADLMGCIADTGLSLLDTLAWLLQAPRMAVRYLGQQRVFDTGNALTHIRREGPETGWKALLTGAMLGNRRPRLKPHWKTFFQVLEKIPSQIRQEISDFNTLFTGCPTDWTAPTWPKIAADLYDLNELFNNLDHDNGALARNARHRVQCFAANATYQQIARLVDDFHQVLPEIRNQVASADSEYLDSLSTCWAPMLCSDEPLLSPDGLQIVELKCPADLEAEHRALGHCIDSYDYRAYRGDCRLFSVRLNGVSLASAEVQLVVSAGNLIPSKWGLQHLLTAQLRGHRNRTPEPGSQVDQAYKWFWLKVKSGGIPINLEWPDQTRYISRYANQDQKNRRAQACAQWITQRLHHS